MSLLFTYRTVRKNLTTTLQGLYNLSDEQCEHQALDRLSFQRFCRLDGALNIPDARTLWNFRQRLAEGGLGGRAIFEALSQQLQRHGFIPRGGQIVDASIVQVPIAQANPRKREAPRGKRPRAGARSGWRTPTGTHAGRSSTASPTTATSCTQAAQQDDQPHAGAGRARVRGTEPAGRHVRAGDDAGAQCAGHHAAVRGLQRAPAGVAGQERRCVFTARVRSKTPSRGAAMAGAAASGRHQLLARAGFAQA